MEISEVPQHINKWNLTSVENFVEVDEPLRKSIKSILNSISDDEVSVVIKTLKDIGIESLSDLQFVKEEDLSMVLKPIKRRKLVAAWAPQQYSQPFQCLEKINNQVGEINSKVDKLVIQVEKVPCVTKETPLLDVLPSDVKLPVQSITELELLNEKLKEDTDFCGLLIRYLFNAGSGKSQCSFVLSLTKRVLCQEVALQFSRFGRKGKLPFLKFNETLNVILAAASLKFPDVDREVLAEMFGKALAGASDWNGRRSLPLNYSFTLSLKEGQ